MLNIALERKKASAKTQFTVKAFISFGIVMTSVLLPQFIHLCFGASMGAKLLPMYLPVLIGGCLMGKKWGTAIGILSPVVSFALTSSTSTAMPSLEKLPYMMAELAVFALVCGLFSDKITENKFFAFPAVITAQLAGRLTFIALSAVTPLGLSAALLQIEAGLIGLAIQAITVPLAVIGIRKNILNSQKN